MAAADECWKFKIDRKNIRNATHDGGSAQKIEATNNLLLTASELMWNLNNKIHSMCVWRTARCHRYVSFVIRIGVCPFNIHSIGRCEMCHIVPVLDDGLGHESDVNASGQFQKLWLFAFWCASDSCVNTPEKWLCTRRFLVSGLDRPHSESW